MSAIRKGLASPPQGLPQILQALRIVMPRFPWQMLHLRLKSKPSQLVVMFHTGRSGSTVLGMLLSQHQDIQWGSELFWRAKVALEELPIKLNWQIDPTRLIKDYSAGHDEPLFGFEIQPFQLSFMDLTLLAFIGILDALGVNHFIILERKNFLRQIVSREVAIERNQWIYELAQTPEFTTIELDIPGSLPDNRGIPLLQRLQYVDRFFRELENLIGHRKVLHLTYEDHILEDPRVGYHQIVDFLNLETQNTTVYSQRATPYPLNDVLVNYGEVCDYLRDTPYEWMLEL